MSGSLAPLRRALATVTEPARRAHGLSAAVDVLLAHGDHEGATAVARTIPTAAKAAWLAARVALALAAGDEPALCADVASFVAAPPLVTGTGRGGDELAAALEVLPRFAEVPSHPALARLVEAMCTWGRAGQRGIEPSSFARMLAAAARTCAALETPRHTRWRAHASALRDAIMIPEDRAAADETREAPRVRTRSIDEVIALLTPVAPAHDPFRELLATHETRRGDAALVLEILRADPCLDAQFAIATPRAVLRDVSLLPEPRLREALELLVARRFVVKSADVLVPQWVTPAIDAEGYDDSKAHSVGALLAPALARVGLEAAATVIDALKDELVRRGPAPVGDWSHAEWRTADVRLFETAAALAARDVLDPSWLEDLPSHAGWTRWALVSRSALSLEAMHERWGEPPLAVRVVIVHRLAKAGRFEDALAVAKVADPHVRQALGHRRVPTSHDTLLTLAQSADALGPERARALRAAMAAAKRGRTGDMLRMHRECIALLETTLVSRGAT